MIRSFALVAAAVAALFAAAPARAEPAAAQPLLLGLAGEWTGALEYRDYQTNALTALPVETTIAVGADGRTILRTARFSEGGTQPDVYITSLAGFDARSGLYETAGFRAGRAMSVSRERVERVQMTDPTHWTIVFTERAEDNDRPADIRITLTRNGDETLSLKEVDDLTDGTVQFAFRNQTRLRRQVP